MKIVRYKTMNELLLFAHDKDPVEAFAYITANNVLRIFKQYIHGFLDASFFNKLQDDIDHIKQQLLDICYEALDTRRLPQRMLMGIYPHIHNLDGTFDRHDMLIDVIGNMMHTEDMRAMDVMSNILGVLRSAVYSTYLFNVSITRNNIVIEDMFHICDNNTYDKQYYINEFTKNNKVPITHFDKHDWFTYILYISRTEFHQIAERYLKSSSVIKRMSKTKYSEIHPIKTVSEELLFSKFVPKRYITTTYHNVRLMIEEYRQTNLFDAIHSQIESEQEYIFAKISYDKHTKNFEFELSEPKIYPDIVVFDRANTRAYTDRYLKMRKPHIMNSKHNIYHTVYVQEKVCQELINCGWIYEKQDDPGEQFLDW